MPPIRYRVRPWRPGDKPACAWGNRRRVFAPECGPPVAVVTGTYYGGKTRAYSVCEHHRVALYDHNAAARDRAKQVYRLGREALLNAE